MIEVNEALSTITVRRAANDANITEVLTTVESVAVQNQIFTGGAVFNIATGGSQVVITAAENLGGHRVVTVDGYYASNQTAAHKFKVLGITTGAVSVGASAAVIIGGEVEESSWNWTLGNALYLTTNGLLTQTPPTTGFRMIIGKPITSTKILITITEPIVLI